MLDVPSVPLDFESYPEEEAYKIAQLRPSLCHFLGSLQFDYLFEYSNFTGSKPLLFSNE